MQCGAGLRWSTRWLTRRSRLPGRLGNTTGGSLIRCFHDRWFSDSSGCYRMKVSLETRRANPGRPESRACPENGRSRLSGRLTRKNRAVPAGGGNARAADSPQMPWPTGHSHPRSGMSGGRLAPLPALGRTNNSAVCGGAAANGDRVCQRRAVCYRRVSSTGRGANRGAGIDPLTQAIVQALATTRSRCAVGNGMDQNLFLTSAEISNITYRLKRSPNQTKLHDCNSWQWSQEVEI